MNSTGWSCQCAGVHHTNHSLRWEDEKLQKRCDRWQSHTCVCVDAWQLAKLAVRISYPKTNELKQDEGSRFIDAYRRRTEKEILRGCLCVCVSVLDGCIDVTHDG